MPARLLEVEWPQAFSSRVHVPNSDPPEPGHRASLERKQEGPCQEALLTVNGELLQAAPGESSGEATREAADLGGGY